MVRKVGQDHIQQQSHVHHKENAFTKLWKSFSLKIDFFMSRHFGTSDEKSTIKELDRIHAEVLTLSDSAKDVTTRINNVKHRTLSGTGNDRPHQLTATFMDLQAKKSRLRDVLLANPEIRSNTSIVKQLKAEIALIDKQLATLDLAGRSLGLTLLGEEQVGQAKQSTYRDISEQLSNVVVNPKKNTPVNVVQELTKKGILLSSILVKQPHNEAPYHLGGKEHRNNITKNLIILYKALDNREFYRIEGNVRSLISLGLDPSNFLYNLTMKVIDDETKKEQKSSSGILLDESIVDTLSRRIDNEVNWLSVNISEHSNPGLTEALQKLQSRGIDPLTALLSIKDIKDYRTVDILSALEEKYPA